MLQVIPFVISFLYNSQGGTVRIYSLIPSLQSPLYHQG